MVPVSRYELWFYSVVLKDLLHKNLLTKNNSLSYPFIEKVILSTSLKSGFMKEFGPLPAVLLIFLLVGQRGVLCKAKKSISAWKLRKGVPVGCKIILRGPSLFFFLEEFVVCVLPLLKNFTGVAFTQSDNSSNFSIGVPNVFLFPSLKSFEKVWLNLHSSFNSCNFFGLNVTVVVNLKGFYFKAFFLSCFQIPFLFCSENSSIN